MEISQISALVGRLTDEQLMEEIQSPSGMAPLQIIMGEMQRRAALRSNRPRGFADGGPVRGESQRSRQIRERLAGIFPEARFTSGYRTPEHNASVGGVPNSWHTRDGGNAWDFVDPSVTLAQARARIAAAGMPAGELLRHNAGSGMHLHYSPEGGSLDGTPPPETPAPPPAPDLADGFVNPENITRNALGINATMLENMGLGAQSGSIDDYYANVSNLMPDATAPYADVISRLQGEEGRERDSNRGRALMDAGMAMMAARTPNFMSALAAGGQAGMASRDRIQEEERGLMQSVLQAQLARSQAEQQQARASLEAAAGLYGGDQRTRLGSMEISAGMANKGADAHNAAVQSGIQQRQFTAEMELRRQEIQARADQAAADIAARLEAAEIAAGSRQSPEQRRGDMARQIFENLLATDPRAKMDPARRAELMEEARRAADRFLAGSQPAPSGQAPPPVGSPQQPRPPLGSILGD